MSDYSYSTAKCPYCGYYIYIVLDKKYPVEMLCGFCESTFIANEELDDENTD